jgi:hypothetical protein
MQIAATHNAQAGVTVAAHSFLPNPSPVARSSRPKETSMPQPPEERIAQIKAQFPDRVLEQFDVHAKDDDSDKDDAKDIVLTFVMTGPTRHEYNFFLDEMQKTKKFKDEGDQRNAVRMAIEAAALAQIRWPEREECVKAFEMRPLMLLGFAEKLHRMAGDGLVFRSKKL